MLVVSVEVLSIFHVEISIGVRSGWDLESRMRGGNIQMQRHLASRSSKGVSHVARQGEAGPVCAMPAQQTLEGNLYVVRPWHE